ncbi:hypothetical protein KIH86_03120 [Paenibacillus sp. HN-1]|uniref:hypothetical protein n=1 Tax=Paenibacillus TaxID=44249 RepID=UPI001CAA1D77|nr:MULTISPECIES: hypothetical protein [Paenibacillus]MBY9078566.1 hypothetical protein [Paenibacillus sp. CGMCC 1.18879]MBY9083219.1 hypothetical protein [Paenibacillus sinensis]
MKKHMVLLLAALLLLIGAVTPIGAEKASAAQAPVYTELATFVDGKLLISPAKSLVAKGTTYVPVKLAAQIPGISVNATSGIVLTGGKGTAKLDATNSMLYQNSNYVAFKTLLKIGNLDGKYASSAGCLFIWTTDDGKTKSSEMLYSISKLPGTIGGVVGRKVYAFGHPGSNWVTGVSYDGGSTIEFTMQKEDGTVWTLYDPADGAESLYTSEYLQYLKTVYNGYPAWMNNSVIQDSPFKNMEKVTILNIVPDPEDSTLLIRVRRANGQEFDMTTEAADDVQDEINQYFYFKNPKTVFKVSDKMWKAIQEEKVVVGMTFEEVYLAWGEPDETDDSLGLAMYGNTYLYFRNSKLAYIL